MGVGKRELLCDYYLDELPVLMRTYGELISPKEQAQTADPIAFFGGGGERIG